jgi:transmembrane sensor
MDDHKLFRSLKGRTSPDEEASVQAWRDGSPEHERQYRELAEVLEAAKGSRPLADSTPPSPLKLIHQAETLAAAQRAASQGGQGWRRAVLDSWPRWGVAAAAVLVLSLALGRAMKDPVAVAPHFEAEEFATGVADAATVTLRDGTVVRLGPRSRLRVMAGEGRSVALRGRALFSVAKDPERPFRIETDVGSVEVLGTRFELETREEELRVAVIEGQVALSTRDRRTEVSAGEMRQVVKGLTLPAVPIPDDFDIVEWAGNFLAFRDTPIRDAAREITRLYGVEIVVPDTYLARHTITAWFADEPLEQVTRVFCMVAQARCITAEDGSITIEPHERK